MNSLVTPLLSEQIAPSSDNRLSLRLQEMPPELLKALESGDLAQLKIISSPGGYPEGELQVNGQSFSLRLTDSLLNLLGNREQTVSVKINASGLLQIVKSDTASATAAAAAAVTGKTVLPAASEAIVSTGRSSVTVPLEPVKLADFVDKNLQNSGVSAKIRQQIISDISPLKVSLAEIGVSPAESTTELLRPLASVLQRISADPQSFFSLKPELDAAIDELTGRQMGAEVAGKINDTMQVKTPLGDTFFTSKVKLPLGEALTLNITGQVSTGFDNEIKLLDNLVKLLNPESSSTNSVSYAKILQQPQLQKLAVALPEGNQKIMAQIVAGLPLQGENIFENIYNFYQAATNKDASLFLGKDLLSEISNSLPQGQKTVEALQDFVSASVKETSGWRIVEMPLFDGNQFSPLKIAVKKEKEESRQNEQLQNKTGTRFIVETDFSRLGSFQFDGFSSSHKRNLDLIIRTSKALPDDFCSQIINLFKKSLYNLDYTGTVKINRQTNFVRFQDKSAGSEGIYV